jgi:predicted regulator of Ras-like GTPase activity (Roadblock/LC7/MglB family)
VSFDQAIESLLSSCPGAQGAAIVDADGIPVVALPNDAALEVLGAEFASILQDVGQAGRELKHGSVQQISVFAADVVVILTTITAGYFLVLVLAQNGLMGKGRFLSRLTVERLHSEFV